MGCRQQDETNQKAVMGACAFPVQGKRHPTMEKQSSWLEFNMMFTPPYVGRRLGTGLGNGQFFDRIGCKMRTTAVLEPP